MAKEGKKEFNQYSVEIDAPEAANIAINAMISAAAGALVSSFLSGGDNGS